MYEKERESERSHPSLAMTPTALLHTINRNGDRHTHLSPPSLQRAREREGFELDGGGGVQGVIILALTLSVSPTLSLSFSNTHKV